MKTNKLNIYYLFFLIIIILTQCEKENIEDVDYLASIAYNLSDKQLNLSKINLSTGEIVKISSIDNMSVAWRNSGYYKKENSLMIKSDLGIVFLDLATGQRTRLIPTEIEQIQFSSINKSAEINEIEFDNKTSKIYGIYWNWDENQLYLVSINIYNQTFEIINNLVGINSYSTGNSTFNSKDGHYIFLTNLGVTIVDINNGNIVYSFNKEIRNLEYIQSQNKIIGIANDGIVKLNYSDDLTYITSLADTIGLTSGVSAYDYKNNKYIVSSSIIKNEYELDGELCVETEDHLSTINSFTGEIIHLNDLNEIRVALIEYLY